MFLSLSSCINLSLDLFRSLNRMTEFLFMFTGKRTPRFTEKLVKNFSFEQISGSMPGLELKLT